MQQRHLQHMQHPDKTLTTYVLKQMKHLKHVCIAIATYVTSRSTFTTSDETLAT
jgi:hypothetical protein